MNIIIDTHIFLWLAVDVKRVKPEHMRYIEDMHNTLYLSSMSIAEIMIKRSIGRLKFDADIPKLLEEMGIEVLDFDAGSAMLLGRLPLHHRDPFDRMIIAQALSNAYSIMTVDGKFERYECSLL